MRKRRKEEDFWNEHHNFWSESSSDKSDFVESSFDGYSSVEEKLDERENGWENSIKKRLEDNNEGVQLKLKKHIIQSVENGDAGEYLRGIRECDSSTTEKCKQRREREIKKSASTTRSIVDIFSAKFNKNQSQDQRVLSTSLTAIFSSRNTRKK